MDLDYYTVTQVATKLNEPEDVILHLLETDRLSAALYSKNRKFMVVSGLAGAYVGHAVCWYRGLIGIHQSWVHDLLENLESVIDVSVRLLEQSNISEWSPHHGYVGEKELDQVFSEWEPWSEDQCSSISSIQARPFGEEFELGSYRFTNSIFNFTKTMSSFLKEPPTSEDVHLSMDDVDRFGYNYDGNGSFSIGDLRITHSELSKFVEGTGSNSEQSDSLLITTLGMKTTPWHVVIERVIRDFPDARVPVLLSKLKEDLEKDQRVYNTSDVISEVGDDYIYLARDAASISDKRIGLKTIQNRVNSIKKARDFSEGKDQ